MLEKEYVCEKNFSSLSAMKMKSHVSEKKKEASPLL